MKLITLVAGQTCVIRCEGQLRAKLYSGNVDIAGLPLDASRVVTFALRHSRPLVMYTLEGCVVGLQPDCEGDSRLSTEINKLAIGTLLKQIKKGFDTPNSGVNAAGLGGSTNKGGLRIVVAGEKGSGRYMAGCTIANALNRSGKHEGVIFCDLTTSVDGQLSRLGSLGCIETHPDVPLWEGMQWSNYTVSMMFFHGLSTSTVTAPRLSHFLAAAGSACEAALWMSRQKSDCPIVYVLPTFDKSTISEEMFYRAVLEPIRATHLVFTGDEVGTTSQTLGRLAPTSRLLYCGSIVSASSDDTAFPESTLEERTEVALDEYFNGTGLTPLGASLITVQLSAVKFVSLTESGHGVEARAYVPTACSSTAADEDTDNAGSTSLGLKALIGNACVIPNTSVMSEVPFANIAGYVVITNVLPELDQLELMTPSSDAMLPSNLLVVPSEGMLRAGQSLISSPCQ